MNLGELARLVAELELPPGEYAVFGSGPLLALGIIEEAHDIDVVARGEAWLKACASGRLEHLADHGVAVASFHDGLLTVGQSWAYGDPDIDELINTAEVHDGIPYVRLEHVVRYKTLAGRPKDVAHLARIERWRTDCAVMPDGSVESRDRRDGAPSE
jgi:hypothetical protein